MLEDKFGLADAIGKSVAVALQQVLGFQNGGASLAGSVQGSMMHAGMSVGMGGGYSSTLSGNGLASLEASHMLTSRIQDNFFHQNGMARSNAAGLNQSEIGQVVSQLIQAGGLHAAGPTAHVEYLTKQRIDAIQAEARTAGSSHGYSYQDSLKLQPNQRLLTLGEGMDNFEQQAEKAVKAVGLLKTITGSKSLRELDALTNEMLGMSIPEFGIDRATQVFSQARMAAGTGFGGNYGAASEYMMASHQFTAGSLAGNLGLDPRDAHARGRLMGLAAEANLGLAFSGKEGSADRTNSLAALRSRGIFGTDIGAGERQTRTSADLAAYAVEEKEALALSTYLQQHGSTMSDDQKQQLQSALSGIAGASTAEGVMQARSTAASVFATLSGQSVGSFVGNAENQARLLMGLDGTGRQAMGKTMSGIHNTRMQGMLKSGFEGDASLRQYGLNSTAAGVLGSGISNMSKDQYENFRAKVEAGDIAGAETLLMDPAMRAALDEAGVDAQAFREELSAMSGKGEVLDVLKGKANSYDGTGHFIGTGARNAAAQKSLSHFIATNQAGSPEARGDIVSEFIKGFVGGKEVRGGTLVQVAENSGLGVGNLTLDKESEHVQATDANIAAIMNSKSGKAFMESQGLKDAGALRDFLGTGAANQQKLLQGMSSSGAFRFDVDKDGNKVMKFLDAEQAQEMQHSIKAQANATILSAVGGEGPEGETDDERKARFGEMAKRKEGESDADYDARMKARLQLTYRKYRDKNGVLGIAKAVGDRDTDLHKMQMASAAMTAEDKAELADGLRTEADVVRKSLEDGKLSPEEADKKIMRLRQMQDTLEKGNSGPQVMHVHTMHVTTMNPSDKTPKEE